MGAYQLDKKISAERKAEIAEAMKPKAESSAIDHEKDPLLTAIRKKGGINKAMFESTYGDTKGIKEQGINNVFKTNGGKSMDDLQQQLRDEGYLPPSDDAHQLVNLLYEPNLQQIFSNSRRNFNGLANKMRR